MLSSSLYKNLKPVLKIFLLDNENPIFGISSFVSLKVTFGLCFLHISATSLTVTVSFVKLKISNERKRKIDRELLAPDTKKLFKILPDFKPKKIDDWLPDLVSNPKLRVSKKIQKIVNKKYGKFSKKIPTY